MKIIYLLCFLCLWNLQCYKVTTNQQCKFPKVENKLCGLSFVAPPHPFEGNPMLAVQAVHADCIAVIPYAYTHQGKSKVHHNESDWQWWGERPQGALATIRLAKEHGIQVMLKPQVYVPGSWTGDLSFAHEEDWQKWAASYKDYILPYAAMADSMDVELFCIGTEFKKTVQKREQFWRNLIQKIRKIYKGKLTYAANWDEYERVPFWDALDYIGVNAYFPLLNKKTPTVPKLINAWHPYQETLARFAETSKRPILFTEFGYLSVDGCTYNTWELESQINQLSVNEQAQANAIEALFTVFWEKPYWGGGFIWKWFPEGKGHEGYKDKDYTPQGKLGEDVVKKWYQPHD